MKMQLRDEIESHETKTRLLEASESEIATAQANIAVLNAARDQLMEDSAQLERMLKEAQTVRAFLQGEIGSYKTRCEQYKSAKAEAEVKLDLLREQTERAALVADAKSGAIHAELSAKVKDLEEDLESERAARQADVDVVRQEGMEQVKSWRESLMAEIGTLKIEIEAAEKTLSANEVELEKTRGDAAMAAKVAAVKIVDLEKRLTAAEEMHAASAMTGDEEKQHKHALGAAVSKLQEEVGAAHAKVAELEGANATLERQLAALKMAKDADAAGAAAQVDAASAQAASASAQAAAAAAQAEEAAKVNAKSAVALKWTRSVSREPGDLVVVQRRELFDRGRQFAPVVEFTPAVLRTAVMQIFCEKIAADAEEGVSAAAVEQSLEEFTYDFFLSRFGLRAAAEHHLKCLVQAVERDFSKDPRVQVFGRMIGVANPLPSEACRSLLGFLSQLFRLVGGLTPLEFGGGRSEVPVKYVIEAAESACPREASTLAAEVKSTAAAASKNGATGAGDALDLDVAASLLVRHWEKASEELTQQLEKTFNEADINGDGVMSYDEFRDLIKATAAAQNADKEFTTRELKAMFRDALSKSSQDGSGVTPQAFAATARQHGLCGDGSVGTAEKSVVPFLGSPLAFDEWGILDASWGEMKGVMEQVTEMLGELPSAAGELSNLRGMVADFEGILKGRSAPSVAAWALYRRILMIHATHKQRMEVSGLEGKR